MHFHEHKLFRRALNDLWKKGGPYQKAATEIAALLTRIGDPSLGEPFRGMRLTKNGESRIRHCRKYDLNAFTRLVTIQTEGYCILLYCGDHDDCDRWIERHRGLEPVVGENNRAIVTFRSSPDLEDQRVVAGEGHYGGKLYDRLPEDLFELLIQNVPRRTTRTLEQLDATVTENELWEIVAGIEDDDTRMAVHDVFAQLKDDRLVEAVARIKLFAGELTPLDGLDPELLPEIVDSDVIRRIDPTSPQYAEALKRFMRSARYRDWMLFMHPDQERLVDEDFDGSAKLTGVSGSGKTCVVVRRAVRLAEKYSGQKILVLTLNRALSQLIDELVTACATEEARQRIHVKPFFVLCQELMREFDPEVDKCWNEVTWKSNEHVDEIWQEYYRCETNNFDARAFRDVHDSLLARGWTPERYLREEVDWLRSALRPTERLRYLEIRRKGRTVNLTPQFRQKILEGAEGWEEKMRVVGVVDALGLAQALDPFLPRLRPEYRCVLVDEVQDFGNVELGIVRALVPPGENDLFLCGDAAQAVTSKHQSLREVGITIPGAWSRKLALNYRNSRDVLTAAYAVLFENLTDEMMDREDFEILDPEYSAFSAATPLLLKGEDFRGELNGAIALAKEKIAGNADAKTCIAVCGYSLYEISKYGDKIGIPVLDGTKNLDSGGVFLSDLEQTKGFEFDLVSVVNCAEGVLPDHTAPDEERYRDLSKLYVAMTRAKTDLVLSFSGRPSPFVAKAEASFLTGRWDEWVTIDEAARRSTPRRLEAFRNGSPRKSWREMTGEEFLFSDMALGTSPELSEKLRSLVDGRGLMDMRKRIAVRWKNLGAAADAYQGQLATRYVWGPEVGRQFEDLIQRLPRSETGN